MRLLLDIIIVNWSLSDQLRKYLSSIRRFGCKNVLKVAVVDNSSGDNSANDLEEFALQLQIMCNRGNPGFAQVCNQCAAVCMLNMLGSSADRPLRLWDIKL